MTLPNGWKKVKLGQIMSFKNGLNFSQVSNGKELNFLGVANFKSRKFISSEAQLDKIYLADFPNDDYLLKTDDLVFVRSNGSKDLVGRCVKMNDTFSKTTFSGFCIRGRLSSSETTADYILHFIECGFLKDKLKRESRGTNISNLNQDILDDFDIMLPPIEEQKKIAATLSVWDSAIEKMEKLIEAKESGHAVLMNEMLKNSKTWDCTCLSDIATIKKGKQLNAVDMISDGAYYVMNGGITPSGNTDDWNTAENTISISEGGNSCGFVAFNKEKFWAGGHCYTLIDLNENISVRFLFHYLKNMEKEIMAMRVGSGLPNIQKDSISDIKVFYPSKKGQERISGVLDDSLSEIALLKQQLENYKKQKQGLMQKLLTGQWRVK